MFGRTNWRQHQPTILSSQLLYYQCYSSQQFSVGDNLFHSLFPFFFLSFFLSLFPSCLSISFVELSEQPSFLPFSLALLEDSFSRLFCCVFILFFLREKNPEVAWPSCSVQYSSARKRGNRNKFIAESSCFDRHGWPSYIASQIQYSMLFSCYFSPYSLFVRTCSKFFTYLFPALSQLSALDLLFSVFCVYFFRTRQF